MQPYLNLSRWFMQKKFRPKFFFPTQLFFPNKFFFSDQIFFSDQNFFSDPIFFPTKFFFPDPLFFGPKFFFRPKFCFRTNYFFRTTFFSVSIPTKTATITILTKLYKFRYLESGTWQLELRIWNSGSGIGDWGSGTWDLGPRLLLTNWPFWPIWCGPAL